MQFVDKCKGNSMILTSTQAFQILKRLKAKNVIPRCKLKINLEISPLVKIGVEVDFYSFFGRVIFYSFIRRFHCKIYQH